MTARVPLSWRLRRGFWARWQAFRFWAARPHTIAEPYLTTRTLRLAPFTRQYPRIPLEHARTFNKIPDKREAMGMVILVNIGLWLDRWILSQMQRGLPEIDEDIHTAMKQALGPLYVTSYRRPRLPEVFDTDDVPDLGMLARRSPFTIFFEREADNSYVWDFSFLNEFEHHPGLRKIGCKVFFSDPTSEQPLRPLRIEREGQATTTPTSHDWNDSVLQAICAANTHLALTRHFNYVHLVSGTYWEITARQHLAVGHPIYHLLWPHIYNSCYTNYGVTRVQMLPEGDFVNMFSFTHKGLVDYFDSMHEKYRWQVMDPNLDWNSRDLGHISPSAQDWPFQCNMSDLHRVMYDHALRYIKTYYRSDTALQADRPLRRWLNALHEALPGGIGDDFVKAPTTKRLAQLIGSYIYEGNTVHDFAGTHLWDFQLWVDRCPPRIYDNGNRIPLDVYQRVINNNFALQLIRAPLLHNYRESAMDNRGRALFTRFAIECRQLQCRYNLDRWNTQGSESLWRLEPRNLELSMNG